jgi:ribonuclease HII
MLLPFFNKNYVEAGCDEAGRGCLAGPVVAAAVILPIYYSNEYLNDSKQLSELQREELKDEIIKNSLAYAIGVVDNTEIDKINILNASFLAMHRALDKLQIEPEHLLIDGNRFIPYKNLPHTCVIKGDEKYQAIAAASILAKTFRDTYMKVQANEFPAYGWETNFGYPTIKHRKAIKDIGTCRLHRLSFKLLKD